MFVIWLKYATRGFLRDFDTAAFFARPIMYANIQALLGALHSNFCERPFPIFVIWPKYATHVISRDSETATFFACPIAHANISALPRALLL